MRCAQGYGNSFLNRSGKNTGNCYFAPTVRCTYLSQKCLPFVNQGINVRLQAIKIIIGAITRRQLFTPYAIILKLCPKSLSVPHTSHPALNDDCSLGITQGFCCFGRATHIIRLGLDASIIR